MEFTKEYNLITGLTNGIRTRWTTKFFINVEGDTGTIDGYRTINKVPSSEGFINIDGNDTPKLTVKSLYKISVPLEPNETYRSVMEKVNRITMIDDDMFITMSEIAKRAEEDDE